jgi:hypothetical protein
MQSVETTLTVLHVVDITATTNEIVFVKITVRQMTWNIKYFFIDSCSDLKSGSISDVTTDAIPTERAHTINKGSVYM